MEETPSDSQALDPKNFPSSLVLPPEVRIRPCHWRPPVQHSAAIGRRYGYMHGLLFERIFGRGLRYWTQANPGWKYYYQLALYDSRGSVHIPDHVLDGPDRAVIFETKRTFTPEGLDQLTRYAGLVSRYLGGSSSNKLCTLVLTCQNIVPGTSVFSFVSDLEGSTSRCSEGPYLWHLWRPENWLEKMKPTVEDLPPFDGQIEPKITRKAGFSVKRRDVGLS